MEFVRKVFSFKNTVITLFVTFANISCFTAGYSIGRNRNSVTKTEIQSTDFLNTQIAKTQDDKKIITIEKEFNEQGKIKKEKVVKLVSARKKDYSEFQGYQFHNFTNYEAEEKIPTERRFGFGIMLPYTEINGRFINAENVDLISTYRILDPLTLVMTVNIKDKTYKGGIIVNF